MASEIRVDKINSLSGVGTVTLSPTGVDIAGITTAATLKVGTGVTASSDGDIFATGVTTATTFVGALTGNVTGNISGGTVAGSTGTFSGAVSGTTGTFSAAVSGTTGTFSGAVSGTTGTFTGDLTIPDKIVHTGDTDTAIRLGVDTVTVETGGSERTRVDSSGRFGIGTNNPDSLLHVYGATTGYAKIETGDGSTNPIIMHKNPDRIWHAGLRGDASDGYVIRDATASSNRLTIDTSGNVTVGSGNVVIGTSGKGIDFSATGGPNNGSDSSELLDDYEEGSWTPILTPHTGSFSAITYTNQLGRFIKIGHTVHAWLYLSWTNINTSGAITGTYISGLPYTTSSGSWVDGGSFTPNYYAGITNMGTKALSGYTAQNNTIIVLTFVGSGNASGVSPTYFGNGNIYGNVTYRAA